MNKAKSKGGLISRFILWLKSKTKRRMPKNTNTLDLSKVEAVNVYDTKNSLLMTGLFSDAHTEGSDRILVLTLK